MPRPKINDGVSKQRRYQLRQLEQGLCKMGCGRAHVPDQTLCDPCREKGRARYVPRVTKSNAGL